MKERKRLFLWRRVGGLVIGRSEMGGVPKVRQWMRLKQLVRMLSSDFTFSASMCA